MVVGDDVVLTNLRRGALEYCVLGVLRGRERYGLDIARELTDDGILVSSEGTLYPLLARLRRAGHVETRWQESDSGPPRRYYRLTPSGLASLERFVELWRPFRTAVDTAVATREDS